LHHRACRGRTGVNHAPLVMAFGIACTAKIQKPSMSSADQGGGQAALRNTTSVNVFCVPSVTVCSSGGCDSALATFSAISNGARRYMAEADMIETEIKRLLAEEVAAVEAPARSKKLRDRAEECRALAQIVISAPNVASYLNLAQIYDGLAEQQEQLARDIVKFNVKTSG